MFDRLQKQTPDKILALMIEFRGDQRSDKIDLGVGVYRDASGATPIMRAVRTAGAQILERETTKAYTSPAGDPAYNNAMREMILGDGFETRAASVATPGGTGAIRQAFELIRRISPTAKVWISNPTWPNHPGILTYLKMPIAEYRYFDEQSRSVDFAAMMDDLSEVKPGDVVLLHGCCHNPTGVNLSLEQWGTLANLLEQKQAIPFIDIAYQGFGEGLEEDAKATRMMAARFEEMLIAASCSKNFGIYRERAGILIALGTPAQKALLHENLSALNRQNYSFPPDHGARLVSTILEDQALTAVWKEELEEMRLHMLALRQQLSLELRRTTNSAHFDFIEQHRGMFSRLGLPAAQAIELRRQYGIYMLDDSRINIAGLNLTHVPRLAQAIADTSR